MKARRPRIDVFEVTARVLLSVLGAVFLLPLLYVFSASLSSPTAIAANPAFLLPQQFTLSTYKMMLGYSAIWTGYGNSLIYTVAGTLISIGATIPAAYALSRSDLAGRRWPLFFITLTLFISAGMIPNYLLVRYLGMLDTRWAILLPGAVATWNLFVARSFFEVNIPHDLHDAAEVDGAGEYRFFASVVLPLSGSIIMVLALFYGSARWNAYFNAMIYLRNRDLFPLQLVLREILIQSELRTQVESEVLLDSFAVMGLKYAVIVISVFPLLIAFPFVQKHFVKGVMVGALKG